MGDYEWQLESWRGLDVKFILNAATLKKKYYVVPQQFEINSIH